MRVVGWRTDNLNLASQRAIERLGAKKDGVIRGHALRRDCTVRDTVMYSVTAGEWPEIRAHLDHLLHRSARRDAEGPDLRRSGLLVLRQEGQFTSFGCEPTRPEPSPVSSELIASISSAVRVKSKTSKFSIRRSRRTDFGKTIRPGLQVPAQDDLGCRLLVHLCGLDDRGERVDVVLALTEWPPCLILCLWSAHHRVTSRCW